MEDGLLAGAETALSRFLRDDKQAGFCHDSFVFFFFKPT